MTLALTPLITTSCFDIISNFSTYLPRCVGLSPLSMLTRSLSRLPLTSTMPCIFSNIAVKMPAVSPLVRPEAEFINVRATEWPRRSSKTVNAYSTRSPWLHGIRTSEISDGRNVIQHRSTTNVCQRASWSRSHTQLQPYQLAGTQEISRSRRTSAYQHRQR
jgi:hypothetical protein